MRIALERLSKSFGPLRALDEVTLEIEPGRLVALLGANGAGKTTLLRCLAAIAVPDGGMILYDGQVFRRGRIDLRRRFGFLPDFPPVYAEMSVVRHLGMVCSLYGVDAAGLEDRAVKLLRDLDLLPLAEMPAGTLSRGQLYKTALAGLALVDPELWLLDEPFASGMDPHGISVLKELVRDAAARGRTILYSTQLLDVAERFSDQVVVIDRGRLAAFDTVEALREKGGGKDGVLEALFRRLREERA